MSLVEKLKKGSQKSEFPLMTFVFKIQHLEAKMQKMLIWLQLLQMLDFNKFLVNRFSNRITKNEVKINLAGKTEQELIDIANDYEANPAAYNNQCSSFNLKPFMKL